MTRVSQPRVLVLAGPNGAGKTTVSRALIRDQFGIRTFVNADTIAQGLAGFIPDAAAIAAGRLMLEAGIVHVLEQETWQQVCR